MQYHYINIDIESFNLYKVLFTTSFYILRMKFYTITLKKSNKSKNILFFIGN